MKKTILLAFTALFTGASLLAQTATHSVSAGAGYGKFCYYKITDGTTQQVANDAWDIAFSNLGTEDAGIFINESTNTVQGQPVPGLEAYDTGLFDFSQTFTSADLLPENLLINDEISWKDGAFNSLKDPADVLDYGWGVFNQATNKIEGLRVFAIKLRNGNYKKLFFDGYDGVNYTFRAANLDGTSEQAYTIPVNFNNGSPLVYFSFANPTPVTPVNWDLVFCRYNTILYTTGDPVLYEVAGILSNNNILTAKAVGVDPATVNYENFVDSLGSRLDIIGHDWKSFSGTAWSVAADHAYFVKTPDGKLYKIVFKTFGGSTNGTATFERTFLTQLSSATDLPTGISDVAVFPNPVSDQLSIAFTATQPSDAVLQLTSTTGQTVWTGNTAVQNGLNVLKINQLPKIPTGTYTLQVQLPSGQFARQILIRN